MESSTDREQRTPYEPSYYGTEYGPVYGPQPEDPPQTSGDGRRSWWKRLLGPVIAIGALIFKFGVKLKFLLLAATKIKFFATSASMLVSVAAYAFIFGWPFAVGFVALLFVHEMGHVLQARREGIQASAPMFIPFLGAAIMLKSLPKNALAEARVGLAGPILGALACLVPLALGSATGGEFWYALAFTGFLLNLFNLLPVLPLDGGRAMAALSPWMWIIGFGLLIGVAIAFPNPIMLLVILFGGLETWRRWKERKTPEGRRFLEITGGQRLAVAAVYIGLAAALAVGMQASFVERDFGDPPESGFVQPG